MPRIVSTSISADNAKVVAVDVTGTLFAWRLSGPSSDAVKPSVYSFQPSQSSMRGSKVFTEFIDERFAVVACGSMILVIDIEHMLRNPRLDSLDGADPSYLVRRVGIPTNATTLSTTNESILIGSDGGLVYILTLDGRIARTLKIGVSDSIASVKPVGQHSVIAGTDKASIVILDLFLGSVKSSWKPSFPCRISSLSVDAKGNWFSAVLLGGGKSRMVCGSTRTLIRVFESAPLDEDVRTCDFVTLSSSGLSIVAGGSSSRILILPLDMSNTGTARSLPTDGAILDMNKCRRGDLVALCGANKPVEIISASSLGLVHSLALD